MLKERVTKLKAERDQARGRAEGALDRAGPSITSQTFETFASQVRRQMRTERAATAATTSLRWPNGWKWTRKRFAS